MFEEGGQLLHSHADGSTRVGKGVAPIAWLRQFGLHADEYLEVVGEAASVHLVDDGACFRALLAAARKAQVVPDRTPPSFPPPGAFWQFLDEPVPCELAQVITGCSRVPAQIACEPSGGRGPLPVELLQNRLAASVRERLAGPHIGHLFRAGTSAFVSHVRTVLVQKFMCNLRSGCRPIRFP